MRRPRRTAEGTFETGFVEHAYIEPEAGYAVPRRRPHRPIVAPARRRPTWTARTSRACSASRKTEVRIVPTACGGGFGGKLDVSVQPILAVAAWKLKQPVRIVYSRTESMASTTKRHPAAIWAKASADAEAASPPTR